MPFKLLSQPDTETRQAQTKSHQFLQPDLFWFDHCSDFVEAKASPKNPVSQSILYWNDMATSASPAHGTVNNNILNNNCSTLDKVLRLALHNCECGTFLYLCFWTRQHKNEKRYTQELLTSELLSIFNQCIQIGQRAFYNFFWNASLILQWNTRFSILRKTATHVWTFEV